MWKGLAITLLCVGSFLALAVLSAERLRESYSFIGVVQLNGQSVGVLRPMRPVSLGVMQEAGALLTHGEILINCDASARRRMVGDVELREMILTCQERVFAVKGVLYDARRN